MTTMFGNKMRAQTTGRESPHSDQLKRPMPLDGSLEDKEHWLSRLFALAQNN